MSDYIPFDLQVQIIKWLPVKSLIQFRSVSKAWKSLIDSPDFIADHSLLQTQPDRLLVSYEDPLTSEQKDVSFVDDDSFPLQKFSPTLLMSVESFMVSTILGTSLGLFCLYGYKSLLPLFNHKYTMAVLWNPSIRTSITIDMPYVFSGDPKTVLGFGVRPLSSDPMILKMESDICWKVEVYTLNSGKWRSLPGRSYHFWGPGMN